MIGYLYAIRHGAKYIMDVTCSTNSSYVDSFDDDDDNDNDDHPPRTSGGGGEGQRTVVSTPTASSSSSMTTRNKNVASATTTSNAAIRTLIELTSNNNETYLNNVIVPMVGPYVFNPHPLLFVMMQQQQQQQQEQQQSNGKDRSKRKIPVEESYPSSTRRTPNKRGRYRERMKERGHDSPYSSSYSERYNTYRDGTVDDDSSFSAAATITTTSHQVRGIPRKWIHDTRTHGQIAFDDSSIPMNRIAVLQSIAVVWPTQQDTSKENSKTNDDDNDSRWTASSPKTIEPLLVPVHTFSPYYSSSSTVQQQQQQRRNPHYDQKEGDGGGPTLHTYQSFWSLLLPLTVPPHISDIWRSYISQSIFREVGLRIAMVPTSVTQKSGVTQILNIGADVQRRLTKKKIHDIDSYMEESSSDGSDFLLYDWKTTKLLQFLNANSTSMWIRRDNTTTQTSAPSPTIPEMIESLWIELYERGYIESQDIALLQKFLMALSELQYNFDVLVPSLSSSPISTSGISTTKTPQHDLQRFRRYNNVVLMGQFNYRPDDVNDVIFWVQKWKERIQHVVVRGPFTVKQLREFEAQGIHAVRGRSDKGFVSPMENLMYTLLEYDKERSDCVDNNGNERDLAGCIASGIDGVLYVHDDAFLNVSRIFGDARRENNNPTSSRPPQIATTCAMNEFDPRKPVDDDDTEQEEAVSRVSYRIHQDGSYSKINGFKTTKDTELLESLKPWRYNERCLNSFKEIAKDPRANIYLEKDDDGSLLVLPRGQADFLYVPIELCQAYANAAEIMVDHDTFLECGLPKLLDMIRQTSLASIKVVDLCTSWTPNERGEVVMLSQCQPGMAMYHPFKLHVHGYRTWSDMFDFVS